MKHFALQAGLKRKLAPTYLGLFTVLEEIGLNGLSYKVQLSVTLKRMHPVFHVSSLKKYNGDGTYQRPPLNALQDGVGAYESISDSKRINGVLQYRVHWAGGGTT